MYKQHHITYFYRFFLVMTEITIPEGPTWCYDGLPFDDRQKLKFASFCMISPLHLCYSPLYYYFRELLQQITDHSIVIGRHVPFLELRINHIIPNANVIHHCKLKRSQMGTVIITEIPSDIRGVVYLPNILPICLND